MSAITSTTALTSVASEEAPQSGVMDHKAVRVLLFLLPTLATLGPVASIPPMSGGMLQLYRIAYIPTIALLLVVWLANGKRPFMSSRYMAFLIAVLAIAGSILVVAHGYAGMEDHILLVSGLIVAWLLAAAVSSDRRVRDTILQGWILAVLVTATLALLNVLGIFTPRTPFADVFSVYLAAGIGGVGYPGHFGNPNDLGMFAVAAAPLAYAAAKLTKRPWLVWLLALSSLGMVVASLSRMAALGLVLVPLAYLAARSSGTKGRLPVLLTAFVYVLLVGATLIAVVGQNTARRVPILGEFVTQATEGWSYGDALRGATWPALIRESFGDYFFGAGPGQFEALTYELRFALQSSAHNVFLEVMFEYGVIAGAVGLVWLFAAAINAWKRAKAASTETEKLMTAAGIAALTGLILWGLVSSSLISAGPWAIILGTGMGMISTVSLSSDKAVEPATRRPAPSALPPSR